MHDRRSSMKVAVWLLAALIVLLVPVVEARAQLAFTDVTGTAGVGLAAELTESLAWGDYDNDGDEDLYLTNDGVNRLFRNDGNDFFSDVTAESGTGDASWSVGAAFGDLDNDGDLDLYLVNFSPGPDVLYRNDGPVGVDGAYVFSNVTATAGTTVERSSRGMALLDYDRDGLLDIYVMAIGEYILYHNLGNLQFVDVAADLGVNASQTGVGVVCTDVDNNGWMDIFTGNRSNAQNMLYLNDAGTFTALPLAAGIDQTGLGMGVLSFDHDNDLDFDLYWTSWPSQPNALYENLTGTTFADVAAASGTLDPNGWGISCNAGDVDNDGWQDFFVTNGFDPSTTPNVLFHNQTGGLFADATAALGGAAFDGRGAAFADYDNDGDLDLAVTADAGESTRLWRNDTVNTHHWITLKLIGDASNRSGIGARIEVATPLMTTVQEVSGGAGRGSQNSLPVEFGLGAAATIDEITIRWPSGRVQTITGVGVDQILTVTEPARGDFDGDGDVDLADHTMFFDCLSGPNQTPTPTIAPTADACLGVFDWEPDRDVDLEDFGQFAQVYTANQP
ncbi:MAG: CRTAC1 family protein [bacterium]|nr:CRTAC1 family protein [bacterium]